MTSRRTVSLLAVAALCMLPHSATRAGTPPADESDHFARMLEMLPATVLDTEPDLYYVDMTLVWQRVGVGDDPTERVESLGQLANVETFSFHPQVFDRNRPFEVDAAREEVGFSAVEIDRELLAVRPPLTVAIDETSVPATTVTAALEANPVWGPELREVDTDHGSYFTWGDDPLAQDLDRRSPFRPFGRSGQLAVLGEERATTVRTLDPNDAEAVLATLGGDAEAAVTTAPIAEIAEALSGEAVVQVLAVPRPMPFGPPPNASSEAVEQMLAETVLLDPYLGVAVAEVVDGDGYRTEVLLVHRTADDAARNAALVREILADGVDPLSRQPISELLPGADVAVDGPVLRVVLDEPGQFARTYRMLIQRSLFPSEP